MHQYKIRRYNNNYKKKLYKFSNILRITKDPSSGSLVQYLIKNYKNSYIVSVDMDKVGVMAA